MKHIVGLFILLCSAFLPGLLLAQDRVHGIVFDKQTRQRVSRVFIYNSANDEGGYNNLKGEFEIIAKPGDVLIAAVSGYFPDTLVVSPGKTTYTISLERSAIVIDEVSIIARRSPEEQLRRNMKDYSTAYRKGDVGPIFSVGPTGAGVSIDAIWKLISKEGKNARRLQDIIERDYRESVIDYRFTPEIVRSTTGLTGEALADFMRQYRPSYFFVMGADEYNLVYYIQSSYAQYRKNSSLRRLPPLPKVDVPSQEPKP